MRLNVIIMGAAGRDFHNFNTCFRDNPNYNVVAFTAAQIPDIAGRRYPAALAGRLYKQGIPIFPEADLTRLIKRYKADYVYLSYSDLSYSYVMHRASEVIAAGANFGFLGPKDTMIKSSKPVVAICAVRTGSGKSPATQKLAKFLKDKGYNPVIIRHPMPYGDLTKQAVQRFGNYGDLKKYDCTIEEREEYEAHIQNGITVYAGVDYEKILRAAEREADIILWDGGNNDFPFYAPDLHITVVDPLRAGDEIGYYPGEVNLRMADILIVNKVDSATREQIALVMKNIHRYNPRALVIKANSQLIIDHAQLIKHKSVLVIEDGPTLTHGGMKYGAGTVAARMYSAKSIIDPRAYAVGLIKETYKAYPDIGKLLPAMGYSKRQIKDLEQTVNKVPCDIVVSGTPINIDKLININKKLVTVRYVLSEIGASLGSIVLARLKKKNKI